MSDESGVPDHWREVFEKNRDQPVDHIVDASMRSGNAADPILTVPTSVRNRVFDRMDQAERHEPGQVASAWGLPFEGARALNAIHLAAKADAGEAKTDAIDLAIFRLTTWLKEAARV